MPSYKVVLSTLCDDVPSWARFMQNFVGLGLVWDSKLHDVVWVEFGQYFVEHKLGLDLKPDDVVWVGLGQKLLGLY